MELHGHVSPGQTPPRKRRRGRTGRSSDESIFVRGGRHWHNGCPAGSMAGKDYSFDKVYDISYYIQNCGGFVSRYRVRLWRDLYRLHWNSMGDRVGGGGWELDGWCMAWSVEGKLGAEPCMRTPMNCKTARKSAQ